MAFIHLDPQSMQLSVHHRTNEPWIPSEQTITIEKYAKLIKEETEEYMKKHYTPKLQKLQAMIDKWNYENNPDYKKQKDAQKKAQKKAAPKKKTKKKVTPKKKVAKAVNKKRTTKKTK